MSNSREAATFSNSVPSLSAVTTKKTFRDFVNRFSIRPNILRLFILTSMANGLTNGMQCFSCHGECHSERRCNCQTGLCEGEYCFTEKWARDGQHIIYKGCGKGRPRNGTMNSCEYQRLRDRAFCICNDEDFCNEYGASARSNENATCWHCSGGSCNSKCNEGDYCVADLFRNQYTCSVGPPVLPFHYQGRELQQTYMKPWPACTAFKAGPHHNVVDCACTNPICNDPKNLRDHLYFDDPRQPLLQCHSCAEEMLSETVLPNCRRQMCLGHFCAIKVESIFDALASAAGGGGSAGGSGGSVGGSASQGGTSAGSTWTKSFRYKQWSGCLNTTRPESVLRGTFQRWTVGTRQVTECVCRKDFCNLDIKLCMRASAMDRRVSMVRIFSMIFVFILLRNL